MARADELVNGDQVRLANSRWARVKSVNERAGGESVYNFEVANNHDYFVGEQGLLAHNIGPCGPKGGGDKVPAERFNPDKDALIQIAKDANNRGGVTIDEANTLKNWAKEYDLPFRGPEAHPGRNFGSKPHIHVGPVNHIPIK